MALRQERLADEVRDILGKLLSGGQMRDPRLANVTVTHVKLSPDLQVATVYYRVMGNTVPPNEAQGGLESAAGFFRTKLASQLDVRRVPTLRYFFDESIERRWQD